MIFPGRATSRGVLFHIVALAVVALTPGIASADAAVLDACSQSNLPIVRIGAPRAYRDVLAHLTATDAASISQVANRSTCPAFSYGNDYQLLDWLENGKIDAAIMSEFSAAVLQAGAPDRDSPFYYIADQWPFTAGELRTYGVTLELSSGETNPQNIRSRFRSGMDRAQTSGKSWSIRTCHRHSRYC